MKKNITLLFSILLFTSSCSYLRIDPWNYMLRSDVITSPEQEKEVVSRASLGWTDDGRIRVITVRGTPYERGYQQGVLLRKEIQENLGYFYDKAKSTFHFEEFFDESFSRAMPYIPEEYLQEMRGLAHGSRMPLRTIFNIHIIPEISEWSGKKRIKENIKRMMNGEIFDGTTCSNLGVNKNATKDGNLYAVRILDWGLHRISKLHQYPLIAINHPDKGNSYANIGWVGFLGAISGINSEGITLGEMGYGDMPEETLAGEPMPFLLRDILAKAKNLGDVRKIINESPPTNSFVFLMSDGKNSEAEMYVRDPKRFLVFPYAKDVLDKDQSFPAIKDTVYGGHYADKMTSSLNQNFGEITPELLMTKIIPEIAMPSNFQNVIYDPKNLRFWVSNAKSKDERAAEQPYTFFDFGKALSK